MELAFTKLFNKIVTSSIWSEDDKTRIMWITMLALADRNGYVAAALPGLADVSRMSLEDAKNAINRLEAPDPYSRTTIYEGKRIIPVAGGWEIVTYDLHRKLLSAEERKQYKAEWIARRRRQKSRQMLTNVDSKSTVSTQAEAEAEAEKKDIGAKGSPPTLKFPTGLTDSEWIATLKNEPAYKGIDVDREHGKMSVWCKTNNKSPTRRRFVNWLNRTDRPLKTAAGMAKPERVPKYISFDEEQDKKRWSGK